MVFRLRWDVRSVRWSNPWEDTVGAYGIIASAKKSAIASDCDAGN